jgi:hypothetical protein
MLNFPKPTIFHNFFTFLSFANLGPHPELESSTDSNLDSNEYGPTIPHGLGHQTDRAQKQDPSFPLMRGQN